MKEFVLLFLLPPTPFLLMLVVGFLLPFKKVRLWLLFLGAVLLLLTSFPVVGKLVAGPLFKLAKSYDSAEMREMPIVVPTAGVFKDPAGKWWPRKRSIFRIQAAKQFPGQLFLVGANPNAGEPTEAEIINSYFEKEDRPITVVAEGRNSVESAKALKRYNIKGSRIRLVTSATHTLRMAAALRTQGFQVVASPVSDTFTKPLTLTDFLPNYSGVNLFRQVSYEYFGIALYLLRGDISLKHLF